MNNKSIIFIFLVLTILLIGCSKAIQDKDILSINLREHKELALHIHPVIEIVISGNSYPIPANIGITNQGMAVMHTHDSSGNLHVESPYPHQFYLRDFFTIWGMNLNSTCIFLYCEDTEHTLHFYVNDLESELRENLPLYDKDRIRIVYESNSD